MMEEHSTAPIENWLSAVTQSPLPHLSSIGNVCANMDENEIIFMTCIECMSMIAIVDQDYDKKPEMSISKNETAARIVGTVCGKHLVRTQDADIIRFHANGEIANMPMVRMTMRHVNKARIVHNETDSERIYVMFMRQFPLSFRRTRVVKAVKPLSTKVEFKDVSMAFF